MLVPSHEENSFFSYIPFVFPISPSFFHSCAFFSLANHGVTTKDGAPLLHVCVPEERK